MSAWQAYLTISQATHTQIHLFWTPIDIVHMQHKLQMRTEAVVVGIIKKSLWLPLCHRYSTTTRQPVLLSRDSKYMTQSWMRTGCFKTSWTAYVKQFQNKSGPCLPFPADIEQYNLSRVTSGYSELDRRRCVHFYRETIFFWVEFVFLHRWIVCCVYIPVDDGIYF